MRNPDEIYAMVAQTLFGLEETLASELEKLGATEIETHNRAVSFSGNRELMYKANLCLRTALRILVPVDEFTARDEEQLYKGIKDIYWHKFMGPDYTMAVQSVVKSEHFNHANFVALKTKDAIVDQFREKMGRRPSVDKDNPDIEIFVHVNKQVVKVMLNSSGDSLHKRGYRIAQGIAPLNEVLAAGILLLTGYDGSVNFCDPMCGSGTLLSEALMIARNEAPGKYRKHFGFQTWPAYDRKLWDSIVNKAISEERKPEAELTGSDKDIAAVAYATKNLRQIKGDGDIHIESSDFFNMEKPFDAGMIILNPPYDERLELEDASAFYKEIGDTMKRNWKGFTAWIFTANKDALKKLGLQASRRFTLFNGPHECKLHKYELYEGSRAKGKSPAEE